MDNKISEIINFPCILKYLDCSSNLIKNLNELPKNMTGIKCNSNPLKSLFYPFDTKPKKYPKGLKGLTFGDKFNQPVDNLPNSIIYLELNNPKYKLKINKLPNNIEEIHIKNDNILNLISKKYHKYCLVKK